MSALETQFGSWLQEKGLLTAAQLEEAAKEQAREEPRPTLGAALAALNILDEKKIAAALAEMMGIELWDPEAAPADPDLLQVIPPNIAQGYRILPIARENGSLRCALAAPISPADRAKLEFIANVPVKFSAAPESTIMDILRGAKGVTVESLIAGLARDERGEDGDQEVFIHDLREMAEEPTLVNLVNAIITKAIEERTSDIHVEPFEQELKIKYRIDGILHEMPPPPKQFQSAIVSRIKIMAGMDIAERYVPQDGQIRVNLPHSKVDIRVSTVPTIHGESVVMRLLTKDETLLDLKKLGMSPELHHRFSELLKRPYGIILVCGPTGSGKSTTLYGSLGQIYTPEKKIITIEDPVEYQMNGINQIPVRPKRGLTFATGLRAILRQDPDIVMVGEIRDRETADISIRAALTGHLVFSTLHTNDAPGAITRLIDMGIEPFLIASSVQGLLGQRLVRRLCDECKKRIPLDRTAEGLGVKTNLPEFDYQPVGCENCRGRGFKGRLGIYELLTLTDKLHDLILSSASSAAIKDAAKKDMRSMRLDGLDKVRQGLTTIAEILHVTQFDEEEGT